jgi:mono/diheme cytochrome c family protein
VTTMRVWVCGVLAAATLGCERTSPHRGYEYMPDMAYSVAYKSFTPNPVTRDRMTLQPPVAGTIPRGFLPLHYTKSPEDAARAGRELSNPVAQTPQSLVEGKRLYETYCFVCHGRQGDGDGPIVPKIPNPPAYTSERVRAMPEGQLFHVVTYGSGRMPSYASQLAVNDRWLVVAYVRTLQQRGGQNR